MPAVVAAMGGVAIFAAGCISRAHSAREKKHRILRKKAICRGEDKADAVVIVDPLSTGERFAWEAQLRGYKLVRVLSNGTLDKVLALVDEDCKGWAYDATIMYNAEDPVSTVRQILDLPYRIVSWQVGCESGAECFDALTAAAPGCPTNRTVSSSARRDKYLMGERVRVAGLKAVKQCECRDWASEAVNFIRIDLKVSDNGIEGPWCVLKPTRPAGADSVYVGKNIREAENYFQRIITSVKVCGDNQTVLVQEFLKGKEYVVDSVSMGGDHRCVAIFECDKRPCNGAPFVYFGMRLYQSEDGRRENDLVKYTHAVLDALDIRYGPSHAKVMWLDGEDAPCLVEAGCRPHGRDGTFMNLTRPLLGYTQVDAMLDTFDDVHRYRRLPTRPRRFLGGAMEVVLVAREEGTLAGYPQLNTIRKMKSFESELKIPVGGRLEPTVDFLNTPGSVMLVHTDGEVVEEEASLIRKLEKQRSFYWLVGRQCAPIQLQEDGLVAPSDS